VRGIVEDKQGRAVEELSGWLRVNFCRGLSVDLGAWVCLVVAGARALR